MQCVLRGVGEEISIGIHPGRSESRRLQVGVSHEVKLHCRVGTGSTSAGRTVVHGILAECICLGSGKLRTLLYFAHSSLTCLDMLLCTHLNIILRETSRAMVVEERAIATV
jgi:hypothetical protein